MTPFTRFSRLMTRPLCWGLALGFAWFTGAVPLSAHAFFKKEPQKVQRDFLPPVANINGPLARPMAEDPASDDNDPLGPVTLSAISSPTLTIKKPVLKLDNDLGIRTSSNEYQELLRAQKALDEEDLRVLWEATVEKNPVIRFSLEKLATPVDLHDKKSSLFLNKTLNVLISGATLAATMVPGGSYYRNMGAVAGGDALRNVLGGSTLPQGEVLSATEQIQLAGLVDELQGKLVQTYHDYKNGLQALTSANQVTLHNNSLYNKALSTKNDLAILAASSAYYKALLNETELRQKVKISRLRLERLAGEEALGKIKLSVSMTADITDVPAHEDTETPPPAQTVSLPPAAPQPPANLPFDPMPLSEDAPDFPEPAPNVSEQRPSGTLLSVPSSFQIPLPHDDPTAPEGEE